MDKHYDGYSTLQLLTRGAVDLAYDDRRYRLEGGGWLWPAYPGPRIRFCLAPGCPHWEHRYVAVHGPLVSRWRAEGLFPSEPQREPAGCDIVPIFDDLLRFAIHADRWSARRAANLLERILIELADARDQPELAEPWLGKVIALLDGMVETPQERCTYDSIASEVGLGSSTLRRKFKIATGLSLHQYSLQSRIQRARVLLSETDLPIKLIAHRLRYSDLYFFTRQFRQHVGLPPAAYRKSRQQ